MVCGRLVNAWVLLLAPGVKAGAEVPRALQGTWVIDEEGTAAALRALPQWQAGDEKWLPEFLKKLAGGTLTFTADRMILVVEGSREEAAVTLEPEKDGKIVLDCSTARRKKTLTTRFDKKGRPNVRSSASDNLHPLVWEKKAKG